MATAPPVGTVCPSKDPAKSGLLADGLRIFIFGLAIRILWLSIFPVPYGEDGFGRVYFKDTIFLSHWLPLTQAIVYLIGQLTDGIVLIRYVFAGLGSLAACGFYLFLRMIVSPNMARLGGFLFSANALYALLSLMPYQDVVFLGLFYASIPFLVPGPKQQTGGAVGGENPLDGPIVAPALYVHSLRGKPVHWLVGSLLLGLACLTRYEAWFVLPVLAFWMVRDRVHCKGEIVKATIGVTLLLVWAPLLWLVLSWIRFGSWSGFLYQMPDSGFFAWNPHFDLFWITDYAARMLYWVGLFGSPVVVFAVPGLAKLISVRRQLHPALKLAFVFGLLVLAFFFLVMGKEQDTVFRFSMIPLSITLVLTVLGLGATGAWMRALHGEGMKTLARPACILLVIGLVIYATIPLARLNANHEYRDPYLISKYLEERLAPGETALVVADRARDRSDAAPLAYQRIVAQSRLGPDRIISSGNLGIDQPGELIDHGTKNHIGLLVVFENLQPWLPADIFYAQLARSQSDWVKPVLKVSTAQVFAVSGWSDYPRKADSGLD